MPPTPSSDSAELTPEERWRRWEQRGRDLDARFTRRVRSVFWSVVIVLSGAALLALVY